MSDLLKKKLTGFHLIDASAGTGKTYTITALVLRLLLEEGFSLAEILVVTYTEAAASDLRKRVRDVLTKMRQGYEEGRADDKFIAEMLGRADLDPDQCRKRLHLALNEFDEAAIFTIHGFCQRALQENSLESGMRFDLELEKEMEPYRYQVACDYWRKVSADLPREFLQYCGKKLYPDELLRGFNNLRPELEIIPDVGASSDLQGVVGRYQAGLARLFLLWQGCMDELLSLLESQNSLNRRTYDPKKFSTWFAELDVFFVAQGGEPPKCFENFTKEKIDRMVKKNCLPVEHDFFGFAQMVWDDWQSMQDSFRQHLMALRRGFYVFAEEELQRVKEDEGILAFDDLLNCLYQGLSGAGRRGLAKRLRRQYPAILIDEFQDTDPVQFKIFTAIHGDDENHLLYLIGDPKQAIYNFRGADIFAYLKAASIVKNRESLAYNYRSEEGLIGGVNHLFSGTDPFIIEGIDFAPALFPGLDHDKLKVDGDNSAHIHILFGGRAPAPEDKEQTKVNMPEARSEVSTGCCAEIIRLLELGRRGKATIGDKPVQARDIAVLVRTNKESRQMQRLLLEHGVASVIKDGGNVFATSQAEELFYILSGVAYFRDQRALTTAIATDCLAGSAQELYNLQDNDAALDEIISRFQSYHDLWQERGFMVMFRALLRGEKVRTRLLSRQGGERDLTNVLHLGELLHKQAVKDPAISSLLVFFASHMQGEIKGDEFEQRLESDSERLQILTIHKAKGLEFPIVFCPFLWQGDKVQKGDIMFHGGAEKRLTLDLGSDDIKEHKGLAKLEEMAENLRLVYVAMTRATNRCVVNWGAYHGFATSPLGYLFHGPDGGLQPKMQDDELLATVQDVAATSGGTIVVRDNPASLSSLAPEETGDMPELAPARFNRDMVRDFQVASFSKLTSGHHHESLVMDRDQGDETSGFVVSPSLNLFDFQRGANPGTFLHYLFEHLDFTDLQSGESRQFITEALVHFGYEKKWQPVMETMLDEVCNVQLPHQNFCLADIVPARRLNELEFYFPLARVTSKACASLFSKHQSVGGGPWYQMLESYDFKLLKGFLKGFIDLVFMHDDRYFIIDWKSNYLGNHHDAYGRDAMTSSMLNSGYILQYHLYTLALHRYLGTRLDDYDYDRHFGGVIYVYLRGVQQVSNETGLFWDRPSVEFMADFDRLFSATGEERP